MQGSAALAQQTFKPQQRWWLSVEFDRRPGGRKDHAAALALLAGAVERYDIILENGRIVCRGIFDAAGDFAQMARLITITGKWSGTDVYVRGARLAGAALSEFCKMLGCAAGEPGCRAASLEKRFACIGCHRMGVGLLGYSVDSLKRGKRFWFAFFKKDPLQPGCFRLDKWGLSAVLQQARLCPLYADSYQPLVRRLPEAACIGDRGAGGFWVPAKQRLRTRWLSRYPSLLPLSANVYAKWAGRLLSAAMRERRLERRTGDDRHCSGGESSARPPEGL